MRLILAGILFLTLTAPSEAAKIEGTARVIDGDSLEVAGQELRLHGIDAPEGAQQCERNGKAWSCGREAAETLKGLIGGKTVTCQGVVYDRYERLVAKCKVDWLDLGAELVNRGMAIAYERYSLDYVPNHREARARGVGIFAGEFIEPSRWRRGERNPIEIANDNIPVNCPIKGNINRDGERIYHMPGQEHYHKTRINTDKGERWFCTEGEAKSAGWRRAKK
jgi:endonuclease YncB( thermonuclease family)